MLHGSCCEQVTLPWLEGFAKHQNLDSIKERRHFEGLFVFRHRHDIKKKKKVSKCLTLRFLKRPKFLPAYHVCTIIFAQRPENSQDS